MGTALTADTWKKTCRKKFVSQHEVSLPQAELKAGPSTNPVGHDLGGGSAAFCAEAKDIIDKAPWQLLCGRPKQALALDEAQSM